MYKLTSEEARKPACQVMKHVISMRMALVTPPPPLTSFEVSWRDHCRRAGTLIEHTSIETPWPKFLTRIVLILRIILAVGRC